MGLFNQSNKHGKKHNSKTDWSDLGKKPNPKLPLFLAIIIAVLAGAIFSFSLAPYGIWPLALISPAILYALIISPISNKRAFLLGEAYGVGYWCVGAFWLYNSIHTYGNVPAPVAILAIVAMGLGMGLFHALMAVVFNRFVGKQPFAFASLWTLQEWLKTWVLTGFPWLFVGYAFTEQAWLSSLAPVFGVLAVSFVAVLLASSMVEVFRSRAGYLLVSLVPLVAAMVLYFVNPQWTQAKDTPNLTVSLVQGNIPQQQKWLTELRGKTLQIYASMTRSEWGSDVVIWPESAIPMFQTQVLKYMSGIAKIAEETNTTWIVGVPFVDSAAYNPQTDPYPPFYNSVIAMDDGQVGVYKKQRLVPFGEYVPLSGILNVFPSLSLGIMNFSRGDANQDTLSVAGQKMGAAICYEVAYPDTTRKNALGSDFMLTISNDAWFGTTAGPLQHLQMAQMRALETGRWFVRSTNNGVTAIIDHNGKIIKRAPQFERVVLRGEVQARQGKTPYVSYGNTPVLILMAVLLLLSVLGFVAKNRAMQGK